MVSKGEMWVLTRTASRSHIVKSGQARTLAHHRVSSSSVVEHPTRSRRVVGSNPIWDSEFFFRVFQLMQNLSCYISTERLTWRLDGCISGML